MSHELALGPVATEAPAYIMDTTTQLGGAYRPNNHALFAVKKKLQDIGVRVTHPISEEFIALGHMVYTFDPNVWSPHEIALSYYQSIATCDFHMVCNQKTGSQSGYIGADTVRSMAYALLKRKPIILLQPPTFAADVNPLEATIIENNLTKLHVHDILKLSNGDLQTLIAQTRITQPYYAFDKDETAAIHTRVQDYLQASMAL